MDRIQPSGCVIKLVSVIVVPERAEMGLGEIPDLVTLRKGPLPVIRSV